MKAMKFELRYTILAAMFLAMGLVLPLLTGQIKEIGDSLLPMHIPVLLCGLICGEKYGFAAGLMMPFLRSVLFGRPPMYPNAVWMAVELATYGLVIGLLYFRMRKKTVVTVYISLLTAMIAGRLAWGLAKVLLLGLGDNGFTLPMFITGGFVDALPGILLQLVLIPLIMVLLQKQKAL